MEYREIITLQAGQCGNNGMRPNETQSDSQHLQLLSPLARLVKTEYDSFELGYIGLLMDYLQSEVNSGNSCAWSMESARMVTLRNSQPREGIAKMSSSTR